MTKTPQTYSEITADQFAEFEAKYGKKNLSDATIEVDGETFKFLLRKPNRSVMEAIGKPAAEKDIAKVNQIFIANCVIGGDMEALENDGAVYAEILGLITDLTSKVKSSIKKR